MTAAEPANTDSFAYRELQAVREIAHAFLMADRPEEVHQFALDRVTPLLAASFSLVLELDSGGEFMHPVAQHQWPERHRNWIGALRVRVGHGPSGVAVAERRVVEVADLHADPLLEDWFEVATELGFKSIVAAPLTGSRGPLGAIAFYFADERHVTPEQRDLVRFIADQLAATAEKALRMDELRRANAALAEANAALELQARDQHQSNARQLAFLENFAATLENATLGEPAAAVRLAGLRLFAKSARDTAALARNRVVPVPGDVDPRAPLLKVVTSWRSRVRPMPITVGEPTVLLPTMRSDVRLLERIIDLAMGYAVKQASQTGSGVHADVELGRGFVAYQLHWGVRSHNPAQALPEGPEMPPEDAAEPFDPFRQMAAAAGYYDAAAPVTPLDLPLARSLSRLLGGDVRFITDGQGELASDSLSLIFPLDASPEQAAAVARMTASSNQ